MGFPGRVRVLTVVTTGVAFSSLFLAGTAILETKRLLPKLSPSYAIAAPVAAGDEISFQKPPAGIQRQL